MTSASCLCGDTSRLARNNYFYGKLMVERDFTDEQLYFLDKIRRHNRNLHGWGVVCGLEVDEHPNPACREQYVVVSPGMALDCCGREILLLEKEMVDLRALVRDAWKHDNGPESEIDDAPHTIRLCIHYDECPTEEVPALFDECSCDDSGCLPNRIRDSHRYSVDLDPPESTVHVAGLTMAWHSTIGAVGAQRAAVNHDTHRLYLIAGTAAGDLDVYDTQTGALVESQTLPAAGLDVAVSEDGTRVYVALESGSVDVLDPGDLTTPVNSLPLSAAPTGAVRVVTSPGNGRIAVLDESAAEVTTWSPDVDTAGADLNTAKLGVATVAAGSRAAAYLPDGSALVVGETDAQTMAVITAADPANSASHPAAIAPHALAVAGTVVGPRLAIADDTGQLAVYKIDITAATPFSKIGSTATLAEPVVSLAGLAGGRWWLAATVDASGAGAVVVVDAYAIETSAGTVFGDPVPVGPGATQVLWVPLENRAYVVFEGSDEAPEPAGVAVLDAVGGNCADALSPRPCPECNDDCVPLATIRDWHLGDPFVEAVIDDTDRPMVPSVASLTEAVKCLLAGAGGGEAGPQGPPGKDGKDGQDGEDGQDGRDGQNGRDGADGRDGQDGRDGADGRDGEDGKDGEDGHYIDPKVPRIVALNWHHADTVNRDEARRIFLEEGFVVAFDRNFPMASETLDRFTVELYGRRAARLVNGMPGYTWVGIDLRIEAGEVEGECGDERARFIDTVGNGDPCTGVRFFPAERPEQVGGGDYLIVLRGDMIASFDFIPQPDGTEVRLALDGNHFWPGLPKRCPTGDHVEGGRFESWLSVEGDD